jgi:hypothetical protein
VSLSLTRLSSPVVDNLNRFAKYFGSGIIVRRPPPIGTGSLLTLSSDCDRLHPFAWARSWSVFIGMSIGRLACIRGSFYTFITAVVLTGLLAMGSYHLHDQHLRHIHLRACCVSVGQRKAGSDRQDTW